MLIKADNITHSLTLREWDGNQYGEDFFADWETFFPTCHPLVDGVYESSKDDLDDLFGWWLEEVKLINDREVGQSGKIYFERDLGDLILIDTIIGRNQK